MRGFGCAHREEGRFSDRIWGLVRQWDEVDAYGAGVGVCVVYEQDQGERERKSCLCRLM